MKMLEVKFIWPDGSYGYALMRPPDAKELVRFHTQYGPPKEIKIPCEESIIHSPEGPECEWHKY